MPLFKSISHTFSNGQDATVLVWKITESIEELQNSITLKPESELRLQQMKSALHQRGFLSIRHLLTLVGLSDAQLFYNDNGKPILHNGMHISISHSFDFSTIVLSKLNIGIDIEQIREKVARIAHKFCNSELTFLEPNTSHYYNNLTTIWAAKETIFKIENQVGISFKDHILVSEFHNKNVRAKLHFNDKISTYEMQSLCVENFMLVFGIKISS